MMNKFKNIAILLIVVMTTFVASATYIEDCIKYVKNLIAPDSRTAIWDVNVSMENNVPVLNGTVGFNSQKEIISKFLNEKKINHINNIIVLRDSIPSDKKWALVQLSIATLRCDPKHSAEVATQATMGTPLIVIENAGDWYRVQCPDNYIAYIPESSIKFASQEDFMAWKNSNRYIVTVYDDRLVTEPEGDETVSDLVLGDILEAEQVNGDWIKLVTPDGRNGWVKTSSVENLSQWAKQDIDLEKIEKTAKRMMGSSYLWGGTSTKVTDCSGLVKVSYFSNGIILQRDASQQALTGKKIEDWHECQLCDLLFFGNSKTGRVTHVGLYLRDGKYIHCSGRVKINDLNPDAPDYLYSPLSISRIDGQIGTKGITYVRNHSWYFKQSEK